MPEFYSEILNKCYNDTTTSNENLPPKEELPYTVKCRFRILRWFYIKAKRFFNNKILPKNNQATIDKDSLSETSSEREASNFLTHLSDILQLDIGNKTQALEAVEKISAASAGFCSWVVGYEAVSLFFGGEPFLGWLVILLYGLLTWWFYKKQSMFASILYTSLTILILFSIWGLYLGREIKSSYYPSIIIFLSTIIISYKMVKASYYINKSEKLDNFDLLRQINKTDNQN